jgi:hypothetical protein
LDVIVLEVIILEVDISEVEILKVGIATWRQQDLKKGASLKALTQAEAFCKCCNYGCLERGALLCRATELFSGKRHGSTASRVLRFFPPLYTRDRYYDFLNNFAEKFSKKLAFLMQN